ncbi:MAG: hypothetical protein M3Z26_15700 [Bacteroidota bacterium]|nr:hypothetical protein [Bacteroidota bacterium]
MKKAYLFFVAIAVMLALAVSGCYVERGYERPYHHRYHDYDHHRDYDRDHDYHY